MFPTGGNGNEENNQKISFVLQREESLLLVCFSPTRAREESARVCRVDVLLFVPLDQISLHGEGILPISVVLGANLTDLELESLGHGLGSLVHQLLSRPQSAVRSLHSQAGDVASK